MPNFDARMTKRFGPVWPSWWCALGLLVIGVAFLIVMIFVLLGKQ